MRATAVVRVPRGAGNDSFLLETSFALGSASNGIDPPGEPATLVVGDTTLIIPAGSFEQRARGVVFHGSLAGGRLVVSILPARASSYRLVAAGTGYDLAGARSPLHVGLTIGDDGGATYAKAVILRR
jgi:hypothetical protein